MSHLRNNKKPFSLDRFKPKSTFNFNKRNAGRFKNFTKDDRNGMYGLKDDKSIINEGSDKIVTVIIWGSEDYLKKAIKQLKIKKST